MQPSNRLTVLILLTQLSASLFLPTSAMAEMSKARANVLLNICESAIKNGDKGTIVSMGRQLDSQILPKDSRLIQRADACIEASFGKPKKKDPKKLDEIILGIQAYQSKLDKLCDILLEISAKIALQNKSCRSVLVN
tara:strand:- start:151 stop:561 length:411 start_codon:yes stop_codon:yes gene_type:complete